MQEVCVLRLTPSAFLAAVVVAVAGYTGFAQQTPPPPPAPQIPGITASDTHPNGCVDCHKPRLDIQRDYRLSTAIDEWTKGKIETDFVNIAKAVWPKAKITGKHPEVKDILSGAKIPQTCQGCHANDSDQPLAPAIHLIHLSLLPEFTGTNTPFVSFYGGFCTNCHTLGERDGVIRIKSGNEAK
jgi:hypothetical protein